MPVTGLDFVARPAPEVPSLSVKENAPVTQNDIARLERKLSDLSTDVARMTVLVEANNDTIEAAVKAFDRAQDRAERTEERTLKVEERLTDIEVKFASIAERYGKIMAGTAGGGVLALLANAVSYYLAMPR